ncbi:MAG TPA: phosphotransferase, partial [Dehalococcoidia bacterium]
AVSAETAQALTERLHSRNALDRLPPHLEATYGIRVGAVETLDGGVLRVDHDGAGPWVARVFCEARPVAGAQGDADILRFLEQQGFPAERLAREDAVSTYERQAVLVTTFVDGSRPAADASTFGRLGDLLGRLQTLPPGPPATRREAGSLHHWSVDGGGLRADLDAAAGWLESIRDGVAEDDRLQFHKLLDLIAATDDLQDLPQALIHPDFYLANVIASAPDDALVLVDWTGAGMGPRIAPLAFLLWNAARAPLERAAANIDAIAEAYARHVRLEPAERERLAAAMLKPPLVFDCYSYCLGRSTLRDVIEGASACAASAERIAARARQCL